MFITRAQKAHVPHAVAPEKGTCFKRPSSHLNPSLSHSVAIKCIPMYEMHTLEISYKGKIGDKNGNITIINNYKFNYKLIIKPAKSSGPKVYICYIRSILMQRVDSLRHPLTPIGLTRMYPFFLELHAPTLRANGRSTRAKRA